jgi:predicted flap endonuclease-1-like 5' DNA nuclease
VTPIIAFILGLLIGWLIEWVIDWIYWRRHYQPSQDTMIQSQQKLASLESELLFTRSEVQPLQEKIGQLELEKAQLELGLIQIQQELDNSRTHPPIHQQIITDDLEEIDGIGLMIARRLNQSGIYTYEQLAAQSPEFLRQLVGDLIQPPAGEESLIEHARRFAQRKYSQGETGE